MKLKFALPILALLAAPAPEPREPVSHERAAAILAEAGFAPRRIEGTA